MVTSSMVLRNCLARETFCNARLFPPAVRVVAIYHTIESTQRDSCDEFRESLIHSENPLNQNVCVHSCMSAVQNSNNNTVATVLAGQTCISSGNCSPGSTAKCQTCHHVYMLH